MTRHSTPESKIAGFTLIELLAVILLMAILSTVSISLMSNSLDEARFNETVAKLNQIRNALIGDASLKSGGLRNSFGFLGDIGALPTAAQGISALISQPAPPLPAWNVNSSVRFGLGWNGPYLTSGSSGTDYTRDAWGRPIVYAPAAATPSLTSYGADGAPGGTGLSSDIIIQLPAELRAGTVHGFICERGGPFTGLSAEVELNYPNGSGALTQASVALTAADKGRFSFSNVPFGIRSITIYRPSKAAPTATTGPVLIVVDKPDMMVDCRQLDIDP